MALFELRQHKVRPGRLPELLELMEGEVIPFVVPKGMVVTASFRTETDPSVCIWIRRFDDQQHLEDLYAAGYESAHWKSVLSPKIGELLIREDAVIQRLMPTEMSPMQ